jgi:RNA polymerase sigma factor (sigma-70 family)
MACCATAIAIPGPFLDLSRFMKRAVPMTARVIPQRSSCVDETRMSLLLRARNAADPDAFTEFYQVYAPLLQRFVQSRGVDETSSDDVVQELLISLWRRLPELDFDKTRGRFRTYLWQSTHHAVTSWYRKNAKHLKSRVADLDSRMLELEYESQGVPDREFQLAVRNRILEVVLKRIQNEVSDLEWQKFKRHVLDGVSALELSRELNCSANSIYQAANRLRKRIRTMFDEYGEEFDV